MINYKPAFEIPAELQKRHHLTKSQYLKPGLEQTIKAMQPMGDFKWVEVTPYDIDVEINIILLFKDEEGRWATAAGSNSKAQIAKWASQFQGDDEIVRPLVVAHQTLKAMQYDPEARKLVEVYPDTINVDQDVVMFYADNTGRYFTVPDADWHEDIERWAAQWKAY